jgi:predicted SprT family Zn-dependent metalloprotease
MAIFPSRKGWECDGCDRCFNNRRSLDEHLERSNAHNWCFTCDRDFRSRKRLKDHYINDPAHIYCASCEWEFDDEHELRTHMVAEHFMCVQCERRHDSRADLSRHRMNDHIYCASCQEFFPTQRGLDEHRGDKHHFCVPCDQQFQNASNLRQHMNSATHKPKSFACPMRGCLASFVSLSALINHAEVGKCPSGVKRWQIDQWFAHFDVSGTFTDRKRLTGVNTQNKYSLSPDIQYQASKQTWNGSAYECYICHSTFPALTHLNAHLASPAHAAKIYRYPPNGGCSRQFSTLSALFRHIEDQSLR